MDNVWNFCLKDMAKLMTTRDDMHNKEIQNQQKKMVAFDKRVQEIDKQLKEEEEKKKTEEAKALAAQAESTKKDGKDSKKTDKKETKEPPKDQPKPGKKGGKGEPVASNPLEQEKIDIQKEMDKCKAVIDKYTLKLDKLKDMQNKYNKIDPTNLQLELVDKTGERKYVKPKLMNIANTFLTDKGSYYLTKVNVPPQPEQEETVELLNIDGFSIRTIEEDEKYVDVPETIIKGAKDSKKGKKGK